jgi:hypothetical protein
MCAGTAGSGGTFTITFTDSTTSGCTKVFTITDPGNCAPSVLCVHLYNLALQRFRSMGTKVKTKVKIKAKVKIK